MTEQQPDERWEAILGMLESIASLDFSRSLPISDEADNMDAVASGLNMLSEELKANVVEKSELAETVRALQWYRSMATASSDLMVLVDPTYTYRAVNQAYCDEHQRTREEILGHTITDVFGKEMFEATLKLHLDRCLKGEHVSFDFWWTSPSRGRRHVEVRYDPFYEADGSVSGVAVNLRDSTDRKRSKEECERSLTALEAANLELELFSASLAHDLRNPLLTVTNFSAHLAEELDDSLDHQLKDDLGRV